jgi:HD-like signal output (HDOD) protein
MKSGEVSVTVDIRSEITSRNDLLALPEAVLKVLALAENEDVSFDLLSVVIGKDPALAGRLLKIANSSFYGLDQRVSSIQQAVMMLGLTTVKCLVLSAALFDPRKIAGVLEVDIKCLYHNMISVATTSRKLAVAAGYKTPEDAFTAGLLHEVGFIYFLQNFPHEYRGIITELKRRGNLIEEEKRVFGIGHAEAGELIGRKWMLPEHMARAVGNHHSFGYKDSSKLDDILRLAVVLNKEDIITVGNDLEEKISKISVISGRLGITMQQLDDITATILRDTVAFARAADIEIEDYESLLTKANQEIFRTYFSLQQIFKERQELTRNILSEERQQGIQEAKQIAIATLSHYINNAIMIISGQSQVARMSLKTKSDAEIVELVPRLLENIDDSVRKIVAVLEEISELNSLDNVTYFEQSKILNIDERIKERLLGLKNLLPFGNQTVLHVPAD